MGSHLIMDFVGVDSMDLDSYEAVHSMMTEAISLSNAMIIGKNFKKTLSGRSSSHKD